MDFVAEAMGPKPNQALVNLAHYAETKSADDSDVTDSGSHELLAAQSAELYTEIERLCGLREDGTTPPSCARDKMTPSDDETLSSLTPVEAIAHSAHDVPAESRPLLATQAADLAALAPEQDLPELPVLEPGPAIELATQQLEWEYSQVYGLDFARAFLEGESVTAVDAQIKEMESRIDVLRAALANAESIPVPQAAYTSEGSQLPTDPASATAFVAQLSKSEGTFWREQLAAAMACIDSSSGKDTMSQINPEWVVWLAKVAGKTTAN